MITADQAKQNVFNFLEKEYEDVLNEINEGVKKASPEGENTFCYTGNRKLIFKIRDYLEEMNYETITLFDGHISTLNIAW